MPTRRSVLTAWSLRAAADVHWTAILSLQPGDPEDGVAADRALQPSVSGVVENTSFGMSRQRPACSICAGMAPRCWSAVGGRRHLNCAQLQAYFEGINGACT